MPYFVDWYLKNFSVIFGVPKSLQLKSKYLESIINQCLGQAQKIFTSLLLLPTILICVGMPKDWERSGFLQFWYFVLGIVWISSKYVVYLAILCYFGFFF